MRSPGHLSSRLFPRWQMARRVWSAVLILLGSAQCRGVKYTHVVVQQNWLISNKETLWQGIFNKGQRELSCPIRLRTRVGASDTDEPRRQGRGLWVVTPGLAPGRPCQRGVPGCGLTGTLPAGAVVTGWRARSKRGEVTVRALVTGSWHTWWRLPRSHMVWQRTADCKGWRGAVLSFSFKKIYLK